MKRCLIAISIAILLGISFAAEAKPRKGFHTGPYILLEAGATQNDFDVNARTGEKIGTEFEPAVGFLFGWNMFDWFSAELGGRYSTSEKNDRREHIAGANLNAKFFLVTDALTDFPSLRILPFAKAGAAIRVATLPGDPDAINDEVVTSFAYGPSVGAGMMFLWKKYVYFGFNVQGDLLFFQDISQDISSGGSTQNALIYEGGFIPQFAGTVLVGVHF
jgi:hypothetical protein